MAGQLQEKGLLILDRDGVINQDSPAFVKSADEWLPLPGSIDAIARLSSAGYSVCVASNQSGLARGLFDGAALDAMHTKLQHLVEVAGGSIDRIVICPHAPDEGCDCRKPQPGLLYQLGEYFATDLAGVPIIGDSLRDLQAAVAAGSRAILVRTGNGRETEQQLTDSFSSVEVFDDLAAAADVLVRE